MRSGPGLQSASELSRMWVRQLRPFMFLSRGPGHAVLLNPTGAALRTSAVGSRADFVGATPRAEAVGLDALEARSNYLIGTPENWQIGVQVYGRLEYRNINPVARCKIRGWRRFMSGSISLTLD